MSYSRILGFGWRLGCFGTQLLWLLWWLSWFSCVLNRSFAVVMVPVVYVRMLIVAELIEFIVSRSPTRVSILILLGLTKASPNAKKQS